MADSTYLSVEAVADETAASAGNSQMTPVVTGGDIFIDSAAFTGWPVPGKTKSVRYHGTTAAGTCYSAVTPSSPSGGWEWLFPIYWASNPSAATSFFQPRPSSGANCDIKMTAAGVIEIYNTANSLRKSFAPLAPGAYWFGIYVKPSSTVGEITFTVWNAVTGALVETWSSTTENLNANPIASFRIGCKVNSSSITWDCWIGQVQVNYTNESALTLAPPITDPVGAFHLQNGWIYDDTTDASAGTLNISNVVLDPVTPYVVDNANDLIAVERVEADIDFSYRVTNATTTRYTTVTGTIPGSNEGSPPNPARRMRMIDGELVEIY